MKNTLLVASAVALTMALGACAKTMTPAPQAAAMEKCFGVAKAGGNDCKAGSHACAGMSTTDADPASFVEVPAGTCAKIAGGIPG